MTKGDYERIIPIHPHLIEQGFLGYVDQRRRNVCRCSTIRSGRAAPTAPIRSG
jgi:hypothetical protein